MTKAQVPSGLDVIVPVHGRFDLLDLCLRSVHANTTVDHRVIVVDDASVGGPPLLGEENYSVSAQLMCRQTNGGFARAVNTGLAASRSQYVAILNSDAQVLPGWDTSLMDALVSPVALAAAVQVDDDHVVTEAGTVVGNDGHVALLGDDVDETAGRPRRVPAVSAACVMAKRESLLAVGGLSVSYGAGYYEDVDLSLLLSRLGCRCVVVDDARIVHEGNASFGLDRAQLRSAIGREALRRLWPWELRGAPSIHAWERYEHRRRFAQSSASAGRVMLLSSSESQRLSFGLAAMDVDVEMVESSTAAVSGDGFANWADVVVGSHQQLVEVGAALDWAQPRAIRIEHSSSVLNDLEENGIGGGVAPSWDTVRVPGRGNSVAVGGSRDY